MPLVAGGMGDGITVVETTPELVTAVQTDTIILSDQEETMEIQASVGAITITVTGGQ